MSCSNQDDQILSPSEREQYIQELLSLQSRQIDLIERPSENGLYKSPQAPDEDILIETAKELDRITKEFVVEHKDILKHYLPETQLTQDSLDVLSVDPEAIREYLSDNFSQDFVDVFLGVKDFSEKDLKDAILSLNPIEEFMLVHKNSFSLLLANYEESQLFNQNSSTKRLFSEETPAQKCTKQYNEQVLRCDLTAKSISVIGTGVVFLCSVITGGIGMIPAVAAETIFSAEACAVYVACVSTAQSDYEKCLKKNK